MVVDMNLKPMLVAITLLCSNASVGAGGYGTPVPMTLKGSQTFYVSGRIPGVEPTEFMVDTGSSYLTINQVTLDQLRLNGQAEYLRDLIAVLANGDELVMPVYRIAKIVFGDRCELFEVEAVVFPGETRQILGLSALKKAAPFSFSIDPPVLQLSNCTQQLSRAE